MMKSRLVFGVAIAALAAAAPVDAAVYLITVTGSVASGTDGIGLFGPRNADLTGRSFSARYRLYDPAPGAVVYHNPGYSSGYGGSDYAAGDLLTGTVVIGGVAAHMPTTTGKVTAYDASYALEDQLSYEVVLTRRTPNRAIFAGLLTALYSPTVDFIDGSTLHPVGTYDLQSGIASYAALSAYEYSMPADTLIGTTELVFSLSSFEISAAPEPAGWGLMIAGFGAVGGAMRRRRQRGKTAPRQSRVSRLAAAGRPRASRA